MEVRGYILSLIGAAAVSALIDGFVPDGGSEMKKYLRYLMGLIVLLVLLSPVRELLLLIPSAIDSASASLESADAMARANSIVAMHIEDAICEKFSLDDALTAVTYDGSLHVRTKKRIGIFSQDIETYILDHFGVLAEVVLYE